jgi:hypothetical protein
MENYKFLFYKENGENSVYDKLLFIIFITTILYINYLYLFVLLY